MREFISLRYLVISLTFFSIFLYPLTLLGQTPKSRSARELSVWQQRVNGLIDSILDDVKSLENYEKALYLALLAKVLWKSNPVEANQFLKKSADVMLSDIGSDERANFERKVKYSQKIIQITTGLDVKAGQSLAEKTAKILEGKHDGSTALADSFVLIAVEVADNNPSLAFALGVKSLTYGKSLLLAGLILKLKHKNPRLAEDLYLFSLNAARQNYDYQFTGRLGNIVFDEHDDAPFSDALRRSYLELIADLISQASMNESERTGRCEIITLATPILDKFDQYLPDRSQTVRQEIFICVPFSHPFTAEIAKAQISGNEPQTTDELIRAARDVKDRGLKARYFYKAISKLEQMKRFDEIISLLDDMTDDEIRAVGNVAWESWRIEYAYQSALTYLENKDMSSVYRIIDRTPSKNRPYVRFRLAYKLSPTAYRDFILENLEKIRKELGSLEIATSDAASNYLSLTRLYLKIQPTDSEGTFRDAVKYINKTDNDNPDFLPEKDFAPLRDFVPLPSELLEVDEYGINSSLTDVSSRRSRVRLKLGLLESSLQRLENLRKKIEIEEKYEKRKN